MKGGIYNVMNIREVRVDSDFNDLFSRNNLTFIEWIVISRLGLTYEEVHGKVFVDDTKLDRINVEDRRKTVDFHFYYEEYEFIIEMNNNSDGSYIRNMLYLSTICLNKYKKKDKKTISENENKKNEYYKYINTFCLISLNWFSKGQLKELVKPYEIIEIPADARKNKNLFEIEHINLDKYKNVCYNDVTDREKLYKLLTITNKEELDDIVKNEPLLEGYCSKIVELSKKEVNMWTKELEENTRIDDAYLGGITVGEARGIEIGKQQGIEQGIEQGIDMAKTKMITRLNDQNIPIEVISSTTEIPVSKVLEIIESSKLKVA